VLLDVIMPGIDGYETCRRIKASSVGNRIPVIFVTVVDDPAQKVRGLELGAADFITKPFDLAEAAARIRTHLELARLRRFLEDVVAQRTAMLHVSEQKYRALAHRDPVTGLPNRVLHAELLERALAEATHDGTGLALVVLDLDDFSAVNESLGHHAGDVVLTTIGRRLSAQLTAPDTIARVGGDEFVAIVTDYPVGAVDLFVQRLLDTISEPVEIDGHTVVVTGTAGIGLFPEDGADVEALVRWRHPVQGLLPPVLFIPLAEQSGLIGSLGEEVLRMVCQQISAWMQEGLPVVPVAVNVSAVQIMQGGLVETVRGILAETGVPADRLVCEITESFLMTDREMAFATVNGLKALGVRMSIDDFGTGYSSLSYLQGLHVDELKIDKSFVASMTSDAGSAIIARTVVALGHGLGLVVLAEGVETEEQAALLLEYGCDLYQGFLLSRPVPPTRCGASSPCREAGRPQVGAGGMPRQASTEAGECPPRRSGASIGAPRVCTRGITPAQTGASRSAGSSSGGPSPILTDQSTSGSASTDVAASSLRVGARSVDQRPGRRCSVSTRSPSSAASPCNGMHVPRIIALR
jgi:diguanylate cyclase (GGDEF)-like protein